MPDTITDFILRSSKGDSRLFIVINMYAIRLLKLKYKNKTVKNDKKSVLRARANR